MGCNAASASSVTFAVPRRMRLDSTVTRASNSLSALASVRRNTNWNGCSRREASRLATLQRPHCRVSTRPRRCSPRSASRTTSRLTRSAPASSISLGRRSPALRFPDWISSASWSATRSAATGRRGSGANVPVPLTPKSPEASWPRLRFCAQRRGHGLEPAREISSRSYALSPDRRP